MVDLEHLLRKEEENMTLPSLHIKICSKSREKQKEERVSSLQKDKRLNLPYQTKNLFRILRRLEEIKRSCTISLRPLSNLWCVNKRANLHFLAK